MRCVVLCGAGPGVRRRGRRRGPARAVGRTTCSRASAALAGQRLRASRLPVVAAVHGWCLGGGCELALTCDIVLAAENARFGLPETGLGLIPGAGGTQRLPRIAGRSLALEMILGGRSLTAREALQAGLCSRVVAPEALEREALALAERIAQRPALAVRLAREAVQLAFEAPLESGLEERAPAVRAGVRERRRPRGHGRVRRSAASPSGVTARERRGRTHRVEHDGAVATVTLDRPEALNAQTRRVATRAGARPARALGRRGRALRRADRRGARVLRRPGPARAGRAQRRRRDDPRDLHPDRRGDRRDAEAGHRRRQRRRRGRGALDRAGLRPALPGRRRRAHDGVLEHRPRARLRRLLAAAARGRLRARVRAGRHAAAGCAADEALALGLVQRVLPRDELLPAAPGARRAARGAADARARLDEAPDARRRAELRSPTRWSWRRSCRPRPWTRTTTPRASPRSSRSASRASRDAERGGAAPPAADRQSRRLRRAGALRARGAATPSSRTATSSWSRPSGASTPASSRPRRSRAASTASSRWAATAPPTRCSTAPATRCRSACCRPAGTSVLPRALGMPRDVGAAARLVGRCARRTGASAASTWASSTAGASRSPPGSAPTRRPCGSSTAPAGPRGGARAMPTSRRRSCARCCAATSASRSSRSRWTARVVARGVSVFAANVHPWSYLGPFALKLAPRATFEGGLDVVVPSDMRRRHLPRYATQLLVTGSQARRTRQAARLPPRRRRRAA